ncbi:hypothetical protein K4F52_007425 [Lecanicillium sp. MT-2017a]|nr:hypothetical protein K4F52_007425 [Lecanicillium sp. MT-2017a]
MESFGFIRRAAWANAGFGRLRDIREHLMAIEPRYDPTVFPAEQEVLADEKSPQLVDKKSMLCQRNLSLQSRAILPLIRRDTVPPGEHAVAFLEVQADLVLKAAAASTLRYQENRSLGPLDGIPTAVKDEYDMEGFKTTFGSPNDYATFRLFDRESGHDTDKNATSWCVRMAEEAGAVILGKLSLNEFGLGA